MPRVTGVRLVPVVSVSANRKSLQLNRKANRPAVMTALRLTGSTIDTKVRTKPAPSTRAASTISPGSDTMNARMIRIAKGSAVDVSASTRPRRLLRRPMSLKAGYSEFAITMLGIIWVTTSASRMTVRPRILDFART